MDWLQKILGQLGVAAQQPNVMGGTPPFNPNAAAYTPASPIIKPASATPALTTVTAPGYNVDGAQTEAPHVNSRRQQLEQDYSQLAEAPAEKQNKWLQGLFLAMQAGQRIADPMNQAGAYKSGAPIEWLGNAKKAGELQGIQQELAPIYAQDAQKAGSLKAGIELEHELAKLNKTKRETAAIGTKAPERITSEGIVYERQQDGSWKTAEGIPAPRKIKVPLAGGGYAEISPEKAYEQQESSKRSKDQVEAARVSKEVDREIAATKYTADDQVRVETEQNEFVNKRAAIMTEGEELQNEAAILEGQAADLLAQGGAAEAAKLREKAAEKRAQGRAKINTANRMQAPRSKPKSYTPPKERGKVSASKDPHGLFR